ncbi:MAG: STAS domain-containing protein [Armatimonadetes bacterium]|nr:STAS domain-containing protein [Armatimonadota bacterium]
MEAVRGLTLSTKREGNQVVIYASGELDLAAVPALAEVVMSGSKNAISGCVLHCEEVTFIDSETIKCILNLRRDLSSVGKDLRLRRCSREVARILALLGLSHLSH